MARVLVTGSSDGIGLMAGRVLLEEGHEVTFHARNEERAADLRRAVPGGDPAVVIGDLASLEQTRSVAEQANRIGRHDAIIHNAGIGFHRPVRETSEDGHELTFAVNVLAAYVLTALVDRPGRLVYLSSGMHWGGTPSIDDVEWTKRRWNGAQAYSDTKLFDVALAFKMARRWPDVLSSAVEPGWVATKMGGPGAPDDLEAAPVTQCWLAVSEDPEAKATGGYWYHQRRRDAHPATANRRFQDELIDCCASLSGVPLPG
jgi:NAD(P)-dependent dehydrogenase (short-subunit alcohol dehydrogenase family)